MHKHSTTQHAINLHKCNIFDMLLSDSGNSAARVAMTQEVEGIVCLPAVPFFACCILGQDAQLQVAPSESVIEYVDEC